MSKRFVDRNKEMHRLRFEELLTLSQIGEKFGVTRERVRQIIGDTGKDFIARRRKRQILHQPGKTNRELAEELGLCHHTISNYRAKKHYKKEGNWRLSYIYTNHVSEKLSRLDIPHQLVSGKLGYNILIYPNIKIKIKATERRWKSPSLKFTSPTYKFRRGANDDCDFYIFILTKTEDHFIVPTNKIIAKGTIAFCWPRNNNVGRGSPYRKYHERWDLLHPEV